MTLDTSLFFRQNIGDLWKQVGLLEAAIKRLNIVTIDRSLRSVVKRSERGTRDTISQELRFPRKTR